MAVATTVNMEYAQVKNDPFGVDGVFVATVSLAENGTAGAYTVTLREKDAASSRWFHFQSMEVQGFPALTANRTGRVTVNGKSTVQGVTPNHSVGVQVLFEGAATPVFSLAGGGGLSGWARSLGWMGPQAGTPARLSVVFETDNDDEGTFVVNFSGVYMEALRARSGLPAIL